MRILISDWPDEIKSWNSRLPVVLINFKLSNLSFYIVSYLK